ncbi:hypothetical protein HZH68_013356 [Vespula germanica]|uniref:Uncharacterized protein n=2 Tax=Vespula TaxID=7451 RepID=A0A834MWH6_VESGE|nr:hypothetical protein HZH66_012106 [Vespula vulgaris]KAF7386224.1 hypothetical protein HZH68_013356 [Vespula germanica]
MEDEPNCEITGLPPQPSSRRCEPHTSLPYGERGRRLRVKARKWCPRREWSSPPDAQRAASDAARRGVLYSSVFLGSPALPTYGPGTAVAAAPPPAPNPDPAAVKRSPNLLLLVTAWK